MTRPSGPSEGQELSPEWKQAFRRQLKRWFAQHKRDLPWRKEGNPYRIFVSEVMLQQTTVAMVEGYFRRFTATFPTVHELAAADEQEVLRVWEGLGYYRRARALHAAAKQVVAEHGGVFPDTVEGLMALPGIGRYTAGAIVSIAYDKRAPILETNTYRLLMRLTAYEGDPLRAAGQRYLWQVAEEILPQRDISPFNQALMELGSLICTPRDPKCPTCPVANLCHAYRLGTVHDLLPTVRKKTYTDVREVAMIVTKRDRVLVRQCGPTERWSGLWDFPRFAVEPADQVAEPRHLRTRLRELTGIEAGVLTPFTTLKHGVTRYRITLDCYVGEYAEGKLKPAGDGALRWIRRSALGELPLNTTGRKLATLFLEGPRGGKKKAAPSTSSREGGGGTRSKAKR